MTPKQLIIDEKPFSQRFIVPAGLLLLIAIVSALLYFNSDLIENDRIHWIVAYVSGLILFISIGFGTFFVYPFMYFRGASGKERVLGSLVTFIAWTFKELVRVSEYFTLGETLYYSVSSIFLLILFGIFGQMGVCELICRKIANKRSSEPIKVITPLPVVAIIGALFALYILLIWGVGVHWFYIYMEGYKALFH